jgi:hypothetical protein
MIHYVCGLTQTNPFAEVYLKTGQCFHYNRGQVTVYNAPDAWFYVEPGQPPEFDKPPEKFFGAVNMTTNDAIALVKATFHKLGYDLSTLHLNQPPTVVPPRRYGANFFSRCFLYWLVDENSGTTRSYVQAEVDFASKTIKSIGINVEANKNLWRNPPDAGMPVPVIPDEPPQKSSVASPSRPPVSLPPGMPLPK